MEWRIVAGGIGVNRIPCGLDPSPAIGRAFLGFADQPWFAPARRSLDQTETSLFCSYPAPHRPGNRCEFGRPRPPPRGAGRLGNLRGAGNMVRLPHPSLFTPDPQLHPRPPRSALPQRDTPHHDTRPPPSYAPWMRTADSPSAALHPPEATRLPADVRPRPPTHTVRSSAAPAPTLPPNHRSSRTALPRAKVPLQPELRPLPGLLRPLWGRASR